MMMKKKIRKTKAKSQTSQNEPRVHFTHRYLLNPPHKVTIDLVGLGGTGSKMLQNIARLNHALMVLGHPGLHLRCWDDDLVSESNIGRQLFSPADIGIKKSIVLVSRVNAFFGYDWEARGTKFNPGKDLSNITVTCVDTAKARLTIGKTLNKDWSNTEGCGPVNHNYYWLDIGNLQKTGQVILGTVATIPQPKSAFKTKAVLPTVVKKFPELKKIKEDKQGPSCSLAESLTKQDLFINSILAEYGTNMLWKLFREGKISYHGVYVNLETLVTNPIPIRA